LWEPGDRANERAAKISLMAGDLIDPRTGLINSPDKETKLGGA
jgi:hypothetical protein